MGEKPILFSGPMVNAISQGRKTQTRRVVKGEFFHQHTHKEDGLTTVRHEGKLYELSDFVHEKCPYGTVGDQLWVRETFRLSTSDDCACYDPCNCKSGTPIYRADNDEAENVKWKPSIFMPRWASRLSLTITDVRVERLHDITDANAIKEGMFPIPLHNLDCDSVGPRERFSKLWGEINGKKHPWEDNPWVWVVEFERENSNG